MDLLPASEANQDQIAIVVTASRLPETIDDTAVSAAVVDAERLERLGEPAVTSYLRLLPSVSVATSGPAGSFTQVRIRGAEANHTLLFIDGIRANDPAAGNEPRFELLGADIASRIELVRGPQSALWGSEAIGGVVAVDGATPAGTAISGLIEGGSFGSRRASASAAFSGQEFGLALAAARLSADGIDSFGGGGDRDGHSSNALRGLVRWSPAAKIGFTASGFFLSGRSDFDGFDPTTFLRADTLDRTRNRLAAGRVGLAYGASTDAWNAELSGSLLTSRNRNLLGGSEVNQSEGRRATIDAQLARRFTTGAIDHALIVAGTLETERFATADVAFGGFSNQARTRRHWSITGEYEATVSDRFVADIAVRRDAFSRFRDATTVRTSLLVKMSQMISLAASYGEGIAQPTFYDLYGFFPGSFVGNPSLKPEVSRGFEGSVRVRWGDFAGSLTAYRQRLRDEITGTFDPGSFLSSAVNGASVSHRQGIEAEASWHRGEAIRLSATYAYLDASEPSDAGRTSEVRRPRHSGSLVVDGKAGRFTYGASVAFVGRRTDMDFDLFQQVRLSPYWLAGLRAAYAVRPGIELFGRIANAFDDNYQDVVGYRTEGRSAYAGLRLAVGR